MGEIHTGSLKSWLSVWREKLAISVYVCEYAKSPKWHAGTTHHSPRRGDDRRGVRSCTAPSHSRSDGDRYSVWASHPEALFGCMGIIPSWTIPSLICTSAEWFLAWNGPFQESNGASADIHPKFRTNCVARGLWELGRRIGTLSGDDSSGHHYTNDALVSRQEKYVTTVVTLWTRSVMRASLQ